MPSTFQGKVALITGAGSGIGRATALARIRGRHISTFDLLPAEEIEEGTARADRELPEQIVIRLDQLIAVGFSG